MRTWNILREEGIALVAVMVMSAITLAVMAGLVYMATASTRVSGASKRHSTALEAAEGCIPLTRRMIDKGGDPGIADVNYTQNISPTCLTAKRRDGTNMWPGTCSANLSMPIDTTDPNTYDMSFDITDANNTDPYRCYVRIINTVLGNSMAMAGGKSWKNTGVVLDESAGLGTPMPYVYSIEIVSRPLNNPDVLKSELALLYQY